MSGGSGGAGVAGTAAAAAAAAEAKEPAGGSEGLSDPGERRRNAVKPEGGEGDGGGRVGHGRETGGPVVATAVLLSCGCPEPRAAPRWSGK